MAKISFFSRFLVLATLLPALFAAPSPQDPDQLYKRATGTLPITGSTDGTTSPRIELRTLVNNPAYADQLNLFLLVLANFQAMDQTQMLSYYAISGIHGVPNVAYDGAQRAANTGGAIGYCTHSTQLFPAWHRPYVALFEQAFLARVNVVISNFPAAQQQRWRNAAVHMRWPYYDWAMTPPSGLPWMPNYITQKYVTVTSPSGQQSILNPLFRFDFHPLNSAAFLDSPWNHWPTTLRYPSSTDPVNVVSQEQNMINVFQNNGENIQSSVYNMFTNCRVYGTFSTDEANQNGDPGCSSSLEAIHGGIHDDIGGNNGHMTVLPWAAFDPTFWLHHANVDRLFALWQALYPNSYMTEFSRTSGATWSIPSGTSLSGNYPLEPFHSDTHGTAFTANTVRQWQKFHYTYPEFVGNGGDPTTIRGKVNALYGGGGNRAAAAKKVQRLRHRRQSMNEKRSLDFDGLDKRAAPIPALPNPLADLLTPTGRSKDWKINFNTSRYYLDSSYQVYVFLDETGAGSNLTSSSSSSSSVASSTAKASKTSVLSKASSSAAAAVSSVTSAVAGPMSAASSVVSAAAAVVSNAKRQTPDLNGVMPVATSSLVAIGQAPSSAPVAGPATVPNCNVNGIPTDPACYPYAPTLVGSYGIFSTPGMKMDSNLLVAGSVHLTTALVSLIADDLLGSLENRDVVPFLQKNLYWRIRTTDGQDVDPASIPGFKAVVVTADVMPAANDLEFPTWGAWNPVPRATHGKAGGLAVTA